MTQTSTLDIFLLLCRSDDQRPVMEQALDGCSTAREPRPAMPSKRLRVAQDSELDDLAQHGWGVVAPPGEAGDHLLELIEPLIDLRARQQGREVRVFRSPPSSASDLSLLEAFQLRNTWSAITDELPADDLPFYLLIVGDLQQVPLAVQRALSVSTNHAVGRLSFERDEQYRAYVAKLVKHEASARKSVRGEIVLHTIKDGTQATGEGHANLIQRLIDGARSHNLHAGHPVRESGSQLPTPDELYRVVGKPAYPTVLFTLAHGVGAPRGGWASQKEQKRVQGALAFGSGRLLTGAGIAARPFLPGGVWLMHSAFSAGTPLWSSYLGWLEKIAERGDDIATVTEILASRPLSEKPFVSALAQAALANPQGPLACMGHVDLTWTWAFPEPTYAAGSRTTALVEMMSALVDGRRVGASMRALFEFLVQVNSYLVSLYHGGDEASGQENSNERERALWWMVREELAGYVLLGDPAARMAVSSPPARQVVRRATTDSEAEALHRNARLERAIAERILGQPTQIALKRQKVDIDDQRFDELVEVYREAGMAAALAALSNFKS